MPPMLGGLAKGCRMPCLRRWDMSYLVFSTLQESRPMEDPSSCCPPPASVTCGLEPSHGATHGSHDTSHNGQQRIRAVVADITTLGVDAIVNAANQVMLGGGGVDGAIHRAAGKELFEACLAVPEVRPGVRCPTGEARITPGFKLPARFVIHTVGPVYRDGRHGESERLAACYRNALLLAAENGCKSVAFPCISTGVFGYPRREAAEIAVREIKAAVAERPELEVVFCCFSDGDRAIYEALLGA